MEKQTVLLDLYHLLRLVVEQNLTRKLHLSLNMHSQDSYGMDIANVSGQPDKLL
jgi:hypothetical protein